MLHSLTLILDRVLQEEVNALVESHNEIIKVLWESIKNDPGD